MAAAGNDWGHLGFGSPEELSHGPPVLSHRLEFGALSEFYFNSCKCVTLFMYVGKVL